jgi:hypothetical protein
VEVDASGETGGGDGDSPILMLPISKLCVRVRVRITGDAVPALSSFTRQSQLYPLRGEQN